MGSIITRAKRLRALRYTIQAVSLIGLNLGFLNVFFPNLVLTGLRCMGGPVFYCDNCPWSTIFCPLGVLVRYSKIGLVPFITIGTLGLVGTLGGRFVCGWLCPFGFLQDLLYKIRARKFRLPSQLGYAKYVVLVVFVLLVPHLWPHQPYSFCDGCPSGTLEGLIPRAIALHWHVTPGEFNGFNVKFYVRMAILLGTLMLSISVSRGFCRTLCPLGAIFGLFNKFSLFRYGLTYHKCTDCGACAKVCPVDIDPIRQMNDAECIKCYECTTTRHIKMGVG